MMPDNQIVNVKIAEKLGLTEEEYQRILEIMGRTPNFTELSIFSVMWSEHCSYKNSIKWLKTLPKKGAHLLVEAGEENAGLVDLGDGLACAFKIESHNHPSALEPYQGAATGVGGIHRDIFTMGARPIAALNSLRFGDAHTDRTRHLVDGVVRGIGDYGNCLGVPTVGGETYFHSSYNQNILVNAMSIGVVKVGETVSAIAEGIGNTILIVGSATGKDGIHGATFASAELTEDSADDLPSVQVGDPFQEKLLLEASLESIKTGALIGMQDMGAAGITCSTCEMSAKGGVGMRIDLDKIPTRQPNMKPFEILLSESQERMLMVVEKGKEDLFYRIFDKWDLACAAIGEVTETGRIQYFQHDQLVADVPAEELVLGGGAPVYDRAYAIPDYQSKIAKVNGEEIPYPTSLIEDCRQLAVTPNIASKRWIFEQYDNTVRTNSLNTVSSSDASIIRLKGSDKALVASVDCNSAYVYLNPYVGAQLAVAEAARNIVCSGGKPLAITNCLNFGNPYHPGVYWQFVESVKGMSKACEHFGTPVTGGNVSFYNQSIIGGETEAVYPTPTIGMIGVLDSIDAAITLDFKEAGHLVYVIGQFSDEWRYCEYLKVVHGIDYVEAPEINLEAESKLHQCIWEANDGQLIQSAHDLSEGGLFIALLESALHGDLGFEIEIEGKSRPLHMTLFNECQGRILLSIDPSHRSEFEQLIQGLHVDFKLLGTVTDHSIFINHDNMGYISEWKSLYNNSLNTIFARNTSLDN